MHTAITAGLTRCITVCTALLLTLSSTTAADWPHWRGPAGGGSQPQPELDGKLVDQADQIQLLWKSEAYIEDTFTGAYSSPVVADGKVYVYFYQGDGKALEENYFPEKRHNKASYKNIPKEEYAKRPSPAADEIVLCIDAQSGKTIWKFVSQSTGLNHQRENTAAHCTPAVGEGKVVVQGNTGIIFCIDAETGTLDWQLEHENYKLKRQHRDETVAQRMVTSGGGPGPFPFTAPVITDGLAVIGTRNAKINGKNLGSFWEAYDLKTGKRSWQIAGHSGGASPVLWHHDGKNYVIGLTKCIDPRTGKELWDLPAPYYKVHKSGTPAIAGDILVYSGGGTKSNYGPSAWKLTASGATLLWKRDPKETANSCGTSIGAHRGVAYIHSAGALGRNKGYVFAVDLASGNELARHPGIISVKCTPSVVAIADRVIFPKLNGGVHLFGIGKDFKSRGSYSHKTAFPKGVTPTVVDGYLFSRGKDALYCFSLLK